MDVGVPRSVVLVVDDEPVNRTLARAVLREHEILEAGDADEALGVLGARQVDLVLLDVMMPGIDGYQLCKEIKRRFDGAGRFLPVLLLTALHDQEHRNRGLEAGADDFISKPFNRRELELRVRAFLRIAHQQDTIQRQLGELKRLDRLKDDLAALIVHDLRNPLSGVDGFLQVMRHAAGSTPSPHGQLVGDALLAARNLRETIDDMLKVRLMEESQLKLEMRKLSLRRLAERAIDSLRGDALARRLDLSLEGDDAEAAVDEALLRRAVENLVANGLRYTRSGTGVSVSIATTPGHVQIDVADRGPGIPDDLKSQLFQKYGSVEAKMGQGRRGNGLGLYLVRLIVEAHHGAVTAFDRPGGGTTFRLELPV